MAYMIGAARSCTGDAAELNRLSSGVSVACSGTADPAEEPRSTSPLSLNDSPQHILAQQQILEGSPPHDMLQAPPCGRNSPRVDPPAFLEPLSRVLQRCVDSNTAVLASQGTPSADQFQTAFHGLRVPPISIAAYLERIAKYAKCSPVCFVMAETYLERMAELDPVLRPCPLNVHRLLITGVLLAAKLMDDQYYNNAYYARIGGVGLEQLNALELRMMQSLDYQLRVSAPAVTQALARFTAAADAPQEQFSACFGHLLIQPASPPQQTARAAANAPAQITVLFVDAAAAAPDHAPVADAASLHEQQLQQSRRVGNVELRECRTERAPGFAAAAAVSIPAC